ncbi:putative histone-lysine N-methyltransferase chromatin remodeling SET family [Medicago truncatula]|uniref:Histone-lysine N-methyltransferase, suvh protein, putative n=1 Tax=Medicago truncatula TaxID=3880 RepID=A0A072VFI6_MEDTR|nr:histone-lysine N-methyltransferase family member SUVH9 [Medicago truncatula]XP_024634924.1 histone-lysine N-methyltransferase family member SUVH9 [Medicago truncatula]KEH40794.1 histone-lysine N-methyltransferase, suvh protein, putative [Medicago truncatula]RHN78210.1 putative histone-lysine N-methyltransferase chromatin remodeling SET family [Medicago truncatula]
MNPHNPNQTFPSAPPGIPFPMLTPKQEPRDETIQEIQYPNLENLPNQNLNLNLSLNLDFVSQALEQPTTTTAGAGTVDAARMAEIFRRSFTEGLQRQIQNNDAVDENPNANARAIVPVSASESNYNNAPPAGEVVNVRKHKELVRMTDVGLPDQRQFRDVVRRTRMVYDSVRVLAMAEEEGNFNVRRVRSDLKASATMRSRGLWLNRDKRIVGAIPGICIGDVFLYRMELCVVGLHGQPQAGIDYLPGSMSSNGEPIATSVIVSGGYEDDVDEGDVIIYSGHGGQDKNSRQVFHQKLEGGNLAMERSMHYGIEVRVIRGVRYEGTSSTSGKVYVYDGLYRIIECWFDVGKSGFGVFKFKLWRIDGQAKMGSLILKEAFLLRRDPLCYKPMCVISLDISKGMERVGIRLFNDIDRCNDPMCFEYLPRATFPHFVFHESGNATGCQCEGFCGEGCFCFIKNGNDFPYSQSGLLLKGKPVIFECGPSCSCPPHCRNRVTQKGLKHRLEVFRSRETGWGVRSLDLIQAGAFICEYTGVVLTREQSEIMTMSGDSLIYPNRFSNRWTEWGNLSLIQDGYVPPSYPSIPPLDFSLDVSRMRNVACYISHSSTPNVMVQFVLYDHNNLMFPHIMLFAMENIPPLREFSLDYGVADDELTGKLVICN